MTDKNIKPTQLKELGEFGLIDKLTSNFEIKSNTTIKGVGDDAAVLNHEGKNIVVTTDLLVEGIHFDLMYVPLKHLGYKAVVVNLSDVYAMCATPTQITVSIAVSGKFSVEALELLYSGIRKACKNYDVDLVGGDTTSSVTGLVISITAIGIIDNNKAVYRNGAKPGNLICVSGDLGSAYAGLQVLRREQEVFKVNPNSQPDISAYSYVVERQLKPEARKDIVKALLAAGITPTSMIDVSDGLSSELLHICKQSNCGAKIMEAKIPLDAQTEFVADELRLEPTIFALNGGEDYELLFTVDIADAEKLKQVDGITVIGEIVTHEQGVKLFGKGEGSVNITAQGWNAYNQS